MNYPGDNVMKKELPESDSRYEDLLKLQFEVVKWELLKTAIELKIFDHLKQPQATEQIAAELSTHGTNTGYLLKALTSLGWLSYVDGYYQNTPFAESFLTTDKDTSIGGTLMFMENWIRPLRNGGMRTLVQDGPHSTDDFSDESIWERGARASLNYTRCGRAQLITAHVAALPEFSSFARTLDLGAGPGIIGIAVTAAHPSLDCVVFDQASVCRVADEVIAEYGMEGRVKTKHGDYMKDPIGENYDFVMANFTLNFYRDRLDEIMAKVLDALNPGGVFMVVSDGLNRDKTGPAASVISWLSTCLQGMDMSFERGLIADAMLRAGFVSTQSQIINEAELKAHGPVDMIIGRKANGK
jgi:hypothetical protein